MKEKIVVRCWKPYCTESRSSEHLIASIRDALRSDVDRLILTINVGAHEIYYMWIEP